MYIFQYAFLINDQRWCLLIVYAGFPQFAAGTTCKRGSGLHMPHRIDVWRPKIENNVSVHCRFHCCARIWY